MTTGVYLDETATDPTQRYKISTGTNGAGGACRRASSDREAHRPANRIRPAVSTKTACFYHLYTAALLLPLPPALACVSASHCLPTTFFTASPLPSLACQCISPPFHDPFPLAFHCLSLAFRQGSRRLPMEYTGTTPRTSRPRRTPGDRTRPFTCRQRNQRDDMSVDYY